MVLMVKAREHGPCRKTWLRLENMAPAEKMVKARERGPCRENWLRLENMAPVEKTG
jgi:hypothetical protein